MCSPSTQMSSARVKTFGVRRQSLSKLPPSIRDSTRMASVRSTVTTPFLGDTPPKLAKKKTMTVNFVYSKSVEKAFRRQYNSSAFGPKSAVQSFQPGVEIRNLDGIYSDFLFVKDVLRHNRKYIEKLKQELMERRQRELKMERERLREVESAAQKRLSLTSHRRRLSQMKHALSLPNVAAVRSKLKLPPITPRAVARRRSTITPSGASPASAQCPSHVRAAATRSPRDWCIDEEAGDCQSPGTLLPRGS